MKILVINTIILLLSITTIAQSTITLSDFKILDNTNWKGTLTYKDYTTGKQTSIDATSQIKIEDGKISQVFLPEHKIET